MAIEFGDITSVTATGATVRLDSGRELHLSAVEAARLGIASANSGARVRARLDRDSVVDIAVLTPGPAPDSPEPNTIAARIVSIDRRSGTLHLETPTGNATFRPGGLTPDQWACLAPGVEVVIERTASGGFALRLPGGLDRAEPSAQPSQAPVATLQGVGSVIQVSAYYAVIEGEDGQTYGAQRSRFPAFSFREGDRLSFRAIQENLEIVDMSLLEREAAGFGGADPCASRSRAYQEQTGRGVLNDLAKDFCEDGRLLWHWITPQQDAKFESLSGRLSPEVERAIGNAAQFSSFYTHQARALEALHAGRHVLVLTPTASGKTYCYNPAVLQAIQDDPTARALYVFPLNALLNDQVSKLRQLAQAMGDVGTDVGVDLLIGGLSREYRDRMQSNPPHIVAANPEMLNWLLGGNAYGGWPEYFRRLRYIVLDEVHVYRSLLGLHMASLVRRLLIACRRHGNPGPQFVLSSATVGAPEELAARLTSLDLRDFEIIGEEADGSAQQQRHWMVLAPCAEGEANVHNAHLQQCARALVDVLSQTREELNAILFARSIRDVQYVYRATRQLLADRGRRDLLGKVTSFASALLANEQKTEIYEGLRSGELRAVISTNALEAGIDIGALDVCIIAGFPFHVMRMRQMAGRAGRQQEGAVIYVPHPTHVVDRYYLEDPARLLTQPPESFVIDHENPYVARKHVVACASTMSGGIRRDELSAFGRHLDRMVQEAMADGVLEALGAWGYTARRRSGDDDPWGIGNLRAHAEIPYVICKAAWPRTRPCAAQGCPELLQTRESDRARCPDFVQFLDREYVYRDAHPGAVFEDHEGRFRQVQDFDDIQRVVGVVSMAATTPQRTFADETTTVTNLKARAQRELAGGARLVWGDVRVTGEYSGYFQYELIPRRRCPGCRSTYGPQTTECARCKVRTRPYLESTRPKYHDFPGEYQQTTYRIELTTVACWLVLPAQLDTSLETISACKIQGESNHVAKLLAEPGFPDASKVEATFGLTPEAATAVVGYCREHGQRLRRSRAPRGYNRIYPAFYGQCLRYHLRQHLSEADALEAYGKATGYPVLTDERHICRNCVASALLISAHTLSHLVALRYPMEALGDSQDLGFTTDLLHPETQTTTVFWYDNFDGGIGAAEKIYQKFDALLQRALESLDCACRPDEGCPQCTQTPRCDRGNEALSKVAARGLIHLLQGKPAYVPQAAVYWRKKGAEARERRARGSERASGTVHAPSEAPPPAPDPFVLLRVQPHVHDTVLHKASQIRGEEISDESPPVTIAVLQDAYRKVLEHSRPVDWGFPAEWDAHQVLHVQSEASKRLAHAAYKAIIGQVHPDRNRQRDAWATEASKRVNEAWEAVQKEWARSRSRRDEAEG